MTTYLAEKTKVSTITLVAIMKFTSIDTFSITAYQIKCLPVLMFSQNLRLTLVDKKLK